MDIESKDKTKVLVVFYSMYGNTAKLAKAVAEGARQEESVEVSLRQVEELVPKEIIEANERMKQVKKELAGIPIATDEDLVEADGIVFGTPTRYGNMCAQMKRAMYQLFRHTPTRARLGELKFIMVGLVCRLRVQKTCFATTR